jgi:heme-degrading monooxygenase HmoA
MMKFVEMDTTVTVADQIKEDDGNPVVLINTFTAAAEDTDALLAAWGRDAAVMKRQLGFISTQLHGGIAGSNVFLNYAVWQSVGHFRAAFGNPEFQASLGDYPTSVTTSPHLFRKIAVDGICVA